MTEATAINLAVEEKLQVDRNWIFAIHVTVVVTYVDNMNSCDVNNNLFHCFSSKNKRKTA